MSTRFSASFLALFIGCSVLAASAGEADATSCEEMKDSRPQSIVAGVDSLWDGRSFFELFDFAVTGEVTSIEPAATDLYGPVEVHVAVFHGYGVDEIADTIIVSQGNDGLSEYGFGVGGIYFIPLKAEGPDGVSNYSFLCDPVSPMTRAAAEELATLAVPPMTVATPTSPSRSNSEQADEGIDETGSTSAAWIGGGGLVAVLGAGLFMARSRLS